MPSQSKQKPAFLVRSLNWRGTSFPSLPRAEVKQAKYTTLRVPKVKASAHVKVTAPHARSAITSSVLKPLTLVEKLLKRDIVDPLPRSAKRNGPKPLALIEKLTRIELAVEVSHPPTVGTEVVADTTQAMVAEPPAEVVSLVVRETINQAPQFTRKVTGLPKPLGIATPLGTTKGIEATKAAPVVPGKKSSTTPAKSKAGMTKPKSGPRATKNLDNILKSKNLPVIKPSFNAAPTSPKLIRSCKSVASKAVPRVLPKPTESGPPTQARKQFLRPPAAKPTPVNGSKIFLPAPISRSKPAGKPPAVVLPKALAPSSHTKTTVTISFKFAKPASKTSPTKAITLELEDGKTPTRSPVEINPKPAAPFAQDVSIAEVVPVIPQQSEEPERQETQQRALASILGDMSNILDLRARGASGGPSIVEVVPQQSREFQQQETQQRALASILGDISNVRKLRAQGAPGGSSTPRESPRTELRTEKTDFIDELKDRLAAHKTKLYGSIASFPKVPNAPESSQKDFRSVLRSASVSKKVPEAKVEEVSELQRVFQRRGKKIAALASRI